MCFNYLLITSLALKQTLMKNLCPLAFLIVPSESNYDTIMRSDGENIELCKWIRIEKMTYSLYFSKAHSQQLSYSFGEK